jgi:hypothetical protein
MEMEKWLEEVNKDNILTAHHLDLFNKLSQIVTNNKELQKMDSTILDWMQDAFTTDLVICIGRICDRDKRTISLTRFLETLKDKPEYLTRERYVKLWPTSEDFFAQRGFDHLAGENQQSFSTAIISADIKKITEEDPIKKILIYRHQHIAHSDKEKSEAPMYNELFQAFKIIEDLIKKYNLLLRTSTYTSLAPVMQGYWEEVFTIPWINREKMT